MRDKLRRRYQVQRELTRRGYYEGAIALSEMRRLGELMNPDEVAPAERRIKVNFEFLRNEYEVPTIAGRLQTSLELQCQRCLQALEMPLELEFRLMIDASDELLRDGSLDTLYSDDGVIDLYEVIEDELLLAIPLVAGHDNAACNEYWPDSEANPESAAKENPFAVLRQLKTTN